MTVSTHPCHCVGHKREAVLPDDAHSALGKQNTSFLFRKSQRDQLFRPFYIVVCTHPIGIGNSHHLTLRVRALIQPFILVLYRRFYSCDWLISVVFHQQICFKVQPDDKMTVARTVLVASSVGEYGVHVHPDGIGAGLKKGCGMFKFREQAGSHDQRSTDLKNMILFKSALQPVLSLFPEMVNMQLKKAVEIFPRLPVKRCILKHEHTVHKR